MILFHFLGDLSVSVLGTDWMYLRYAPQDLYKPGTRLSKVAPESDFDLQ